jgi:hypothetical protein
MVATFMTQRRGIGTAMALTALVVGLVAVGTLAPGQEPGSASEVVEVDRIDQIQAAFDAGAGRPRLILLVDPI